MCVCLTSLKYPSKDDGGPQSTSRKFSEEHEAWPHWKSTFHCENLAQQTKIKWSSVEEEFFPRMPDLSEHSSSPGSWRGTGTMKWTRKLNWVKQVWMSSKSEDLVTISKMKKGALCWVIQQRVYKAFLAVLTYFHLSPTTKHQLQVHVYKFTLK